MLRRSRTLSRLSSALWLIAALPGLATAAGDPGRGAFVANAGQWEEGVLFRATRGPAAAWVLDDGFVVELRAGSGAAALAFTVEGAAGAPPRGEEALPGLSHFFRGADPTGWRSGAKSYASVRYPGRATGVDLVLRRCTGLLCYDLELAPGAALEGVRVRVEGALSLEIDGEGWLLVHTPIGPLRQTPPIAWTVSAAGERAPLECRFVLRGEHHYGFEAPERDPQQALVVDPGVIWGTYVGGGDHDVVYGVALAPNGEVVVAGATASASFPVTRGAFDVSLTGPADAFVARISPDGSELLFATYLGGSGFDVAFDVALGPNGEIAVAGETSSPDFPVSAGAFDASFNGETDAFVAVLDASGAALLASTYLGHGGGERASAVAVGEGLRVSVAGSTNSPQFPVTPGAFDTTFGGGVFGGGDAFVARFAPGLGALEYSTFLGAAGNDAALALALDASGRATVAGVTGSTGFPTTPGAFDTTPNGTGTFQDGFVTRLNAAGSGLVYSTFLGGNGDDVVHGLALRADGAAALGGASSSTNFPVTAGAHSGTYAGAEDAFVTVLSPSGAGLELSTYLGGGDRDRAYAVAFDADGAVVAVGGTRSADFPATPWAWRTSFASQPDQFLSDAFVARVAPGGALDYASFLGGLDDEEALSVALRPDGRAVVAGHTNSFNFPTIGGFDPHYDFSLIPDGFVVLFDFSRYPFAYGAPAPSSLGFLPLVGAGFASYSTGQHNVYIDLGIIGSPGWLFRGSGPAAIPFAGSTLLVAPPFVRQGSFVLDFFGAATVPVAITPEMVGSTRHYQFWFLDPGLPAGVSLSEGIEVTYYP